MATSSNQHATVKVGGLFSGPDYLAAYHEAARLLMQTQRLTDLAMPILYLQRHTVELLLKELRDGAHAAIEATQEIQRAKGGAVTSFAVPAARKEHDLGSLLSQAEAALSAFGMVVPVPGLRELVALCQSVENGDETRLRYARGKKGQPSFGGGLSDPLTELPIGEIQHRLSQIAEEEQIGKPYEEVMKADTIAGYTWSLALTNQQLDQELYALDLL